MNMKIFVYCNISMSYYYEGLGLRWEMEVFVNMLLGFILDCEYLEGKDYSCFIYDVQNILLMQRGIILWKELGLWC